MTRTPTDDTLAVIADICRIGAQPGGPQILDALFPGTLDAVRKAEQKSIRTCPVCRIPHPSDVVCKPLEAHDNGGGNYP